MEIKRVGILRGGTGEHYASSIHKGGGIISHILDNLSEKYKVADILIDKDGNWHLGGIPISPADLRCKVDVIWNTSRHSSLSLALDSLSIPNIGNRSVFEVSEKS